MCQENGWEALSPQFIFHIFWLTKKDNPPDYFGMGNVEERRFFFFDIEDPAYNQKLVRDDANNWVWIAKKKKLKST